MGIHKHGKFHHSLSFKAQFISHSLFSSIQSFSILVVGWFRRRRSPVFQLITEHLVKKGIASKNSNHQPFIQSHVQIIEIKFSGELINSNTN